VGRVARSEPIGWGAVGGWWWLTHPLARPNQRTAGLSPAYHRTKSPAHPLWCVIWGRIGAFGGGL